MVCRSKASMAQEAAQVQQAQEAPVTPPRRPAQLHVAQKSVPKVAQKSTPRKKQKKAAEKRGGRSRHRQETYKVRLPLDLLAQEGLVPLSLTGAENLTAEEVDLKIGQCLAGLHARSLKHGFLKRNP